MHKIICGFIRRYTGDKIFAAAVLAFCVSIFFRRVSVQTIRFLNRKLQFHYKVAAIFSLVVIVILIFCTASVNYKQVIRTGTKFGRKLA